MNRQEIEADPWANAEYEKTWDELSKAWERGEREHEPVPVLAEDTERGDKEYFDLLSALRKSDPDHERKRELEQEQEVRSLGPWSSYVDVRAAKALGMERAREHVDLQLANQELRRLYVERRRVRATHDFFSREK